ncbi:hypothetical protein PG996_005946 [Apiospora saccharicola]|uniref:Uncharacterized protein n=1 Tax=Apiospora saccharicola TaxID=335842 RepID=A0ABR1VMV6_9PEZI
MKVSTTLFTLGFYAMALGAPTPMSNNKASMNPTMSLREVLHRIHVKASMGERMSIKDFSRHHLENHPVAPSDQISSKEAIEKHRPQPISFLTAALSGSNSQTRIPEMEQSSTVRAETGFVAKEANPTTVESEVAGSQRLYRFMPCQKHGGKQHYHLVRQYADMVVVGVLAIFLMAVAVIELWTPVSGRLHQWWSNEGAIRLGDEEKTPMSSLAASQLSAAAVKPAPAS